jgi:hypothetical protein
MTRLLLLSPGKPQPTLSSTPPTSISDSSRLAGNHRQCMLKVLSKADSVLTRTIRLTAGVVAAVRTIDIPWT